MDSGSTSIIRYTRQALCFFFLVFLIFAIVLEWAEEYPGSVKKPVQLRWAGIACKVVELLLGAAAFVENCILQRDHYRTRGSY